MPFRVFFGTVTCILYTPEGIKKTYSQLDGQKWEKCCQKAPEQVATFKPNRLFPWRCWPLGSRRVPKAVPDAENDLKLSKFDPQNANFDARTISKTVPPSRWLLSPKCTPCCYQVAKVWPQFQAEYGAEPLPCGTHAEPAPLGFLVCGACSLTVLKVRRISSTSAGLWVFSLSSSHLAA